MAEPENVPQFNPPKTIVREYAEMILVTGVQVLFLMTFIFQAMNVPTGSMQNTINIGDQFFVNKFMYGKPEPLFSKILPQREIKRGDVVVFKLPRDPKINYIKRCIGLPGDEILVKGTSVFINGQEIPEQKVSIDIDRLHDPDGKISSQPVKSEEAAPAGATYKTYYDLNEPEHYSDRMKFAANKSFKIPADSYFMMGDSRDNSEDSRFWGIVPRTHIIGRPLYVYWSFNSQEPGSSGFTDYVKFSRFGTAIK
jgi:signal peptidase I